MKHVVYYPGIEVKDQNWLKFALLFFDKVDTIVPEEGNRLISDLYKQIEDETGFLKRYKPEYKEGVKASLDSIDQFERILRTPERFVPIFGNLDYLKKWRFQHNYTLFRAKISKEWEDFCVKEKLISLKGSDDYVCAHPDVVNIHMALLSQVIGDRNGLPSITDDGRLDRYSMLIKRVGETEQDLEEVVKTAQAVIDFQLPDSWEKIPIENIIEIRKHPDFKNKQNAFHKKIVDFLNGVEVSKDSYDFGPQDFDKVLKNVWQEYIGSFLALGANLASFSLGVWIMLSQPQIGLPIYLKEAFAGAGMSIGAVNLIKTGWKNTKTKRMARRYLCDLKNLRPSGAL